MPKRGYKHSTFTWAQQEQLRRSPYVKKVTTATISFTLEFKELFWESYSSGTPPEQIFSEHGIDPDLLSGNRVWGLVTMLRRQKEKGEPFRERTDPKPKKDRPPPKFDIPKPPRPRVPKGFISDVDLRMLYHQVAYMSQELEFIKKIISAETEGRSKK